jgi:hypothetical protein
MGRLGPVHACSCSRSLAEPVLRCVIHEWQPSRRFRLPHRRITLRLSRLILASQIVGVQRALLGRGESEAQFDPDPTIFIAWLNPIVSVVLRMEIARDISTSDAEPVCNCVACS